MFLTRAASVVVMFEIMLLKLFFRFRCRTFGRASQMDGLTKSTAAFACCASYIEYNITSSCSEFRTR